MKRRLVALGLALALSVLGAACEGAEEEEEEQESLGVRSVAVQALR